MFVIPAIDLKDGKCVRLKQGSFDKKTVYSANPVEVAKNFEAAGAERLHLVDLDGAESGISKNGRVVEQLLANCGLPIQLGGGIRSLEEIKAWLNLGVDRVVVSTLAIRAPEIFFTALEMFGEKIILAVDARGGFVAVSGWQETTEETAVGLALKFKEHGLQRVLYTDIERDGMFTGPNLQQTRDLAIETRLAITASGGVASKEDLQQLAALSEFGVDSVVVGRAFYDDKLSLKEAFGAG